MIANKLNDLKQSDLKPIRGNGFIYVPKMKEGVPSGEYHKFRLKNGVGLVPLSRVSIFEISRKTVIRMARNAEIHLYNRSGKRLERDDKTNITKYANYFDL